MPYIQPGQTVDSPFTLESVDAVSPPEGQEGIWQRYVIRQGANTIVGMRAGGRDEVTVLLEDHVARLNLRFAKQQSKANR